MRTFLSLLSVFIIINGYCTLYPLSILWKVINLVTKLEGKTPIKFFFTLSLALSAKKFTFVLLEIPSILYKIQTYNWNFL